MCKRREAFSLAVLIGRGLVQVLLGYLLLLSLLYSVFRVRTLLYKSRPQGRDFFASERWYIWQECAEECLYMLHRLSKQHHLGREKSGPVDLQTQRCVL